jgi:coatomer subunit beta'
MPLRLEIKKKLSTRSERVKCVEIHPTQPWVLSGLYTGNILIHDYATQAVLKSFEVSNSPVRCAKFIVRTQWLIVGSDDKLIRVYNYNTLEKIKSFPAHDDYLRSIVPHPSLPYIISSSDDGYIKLWDWEKDWAESRVYEGHGHYVMQVAINPKDTNTFASASLDKTIKVWGISGSTQAHFTLTGHQHGVNCVEYFRGGDKPYLVTGGDDMVVKVWDYQTKQCISTLEGHHNNISSVSFHPDLPLIISTSEDGTVKLWHSATFRLENTLSYAMDRVWSHSTQPGSKLLALAYDEGTLVLKLGSDEPVASMNNNGILVWAKNNDIHLANLRINEEDIKDGEVIPLIPKETETSELFPQLIRHNPNGRSFVVCGDGEYVIKSSRAFRNQGYGSANELVWCTSYVGDFAIREQQRIITKRGADEHLNFRPGFSIEMLFGGFLLGVKSDEYICFYDWESGALIRRINVSPKQVHWSESGNMVALVMEDNFFILRYDQSVLQTHQPDEDGYEEAFLLEQEISENVLSAIWLSDCFVFTNNANKLNYCVGGKVLSLLNLDKKMYILGYIPARCRIYLMDSVMNLVSYEVQQSFIEYQIAVVNEDIGRAEAIFPSIPESYHNQCARFLDGLGYKEEALSITKDRDHKFELALQLNNLQEAYEIAQTETQDTESKWKMVGDLALLAGEMELAEDCLLKSKDFNGLLLLYTSIANETKLKILAEQTLEAGKMNIAFACYYLLKDFDKCIETFVKSSRVPEAAFFARSYCPSKIPSIVKLWREDLSKVSKVAAQSLSDPTSYPQHFPELALGLKAEKMLDDYYKVKKPAERYHTEMNLLSFDILELLKTHEDFSIEDLLNAPPECPEDPFEVI